jgi:hypothetical protein
MVSGSGDAVGDSRENDDPFSSQRQAMMGGVSLSWRQCGADEDACGLATQ